MNEHLWWQGRKVWLTEVLPEDERVMPMTIAHDVVATHKLHCLCVACVAYPLELRRRLKRAR